MNKLNKRLLSSFALQRRVVCKRYSQRHGFAASLVEHDDETDLQTKYKPLEKLPAKPPFIKNLFAGRFDTDLLAYPEFLPQGRLDLLERNAAVVRRLVSEHFDPARVDRQRCVPADLLDKLRSHKLYGLLAARSDGGAEFTHTERARIMEIVAADPSVVALLFNHSTLATQLVERYGDDRIKTRFLKPLISGQKSATLCYAEADAGSDASQFAANAVRSGVDWLLSGAKVWVANADKADLFVVVAKARLSAERAARVYRDMDTDQTFTPEDVGFFLVEKNAAGLSVGAPARTVGLRGLSMCEVAFDNVLVPEHMVLGEFARGYDMVKRLLVDERYVVGCVAAAVLRHTLRDMAAFAGRRKLQGRPLADYEFAQRRVGRVLMALYAVESVVYFTTGLQDMHRGQDCELENAAARVFATETAARALDEAGSLLGGSTLLEGCAFERRRRDLRALAMFDHHNDMYRATIAFGGLQHIGDDACDYLTQERNPLFYSFKNVRNAIRHRLTPINSDDPYLRLKLKDHLHPSLMLLGEQLEYCALCFESGVAKALATVQPGTMHDQMYQRRIADCAILLYAMTAVLSRASRSYCIGLQHADDEIVLAETFVRESHADFKELVSGLMHGEYFVTDHNYKKLSLKAIEHRDYFIEDPFKHNY